MKLPLPKFKKNGTYVACRGYVGFVKCIAVKPNVVLLPSGSSMAFSLEHFEWVIDIPGEQEMPPLVKEKK